MLASASGSPAAAEPGETPHPAVKLLEEPFLGDLDGMIERRLIRLLVVPSRTHWFLDDGEPRGLLVEGAARFEDLINERAATALADRVHVVLLPTPRDELVDRLLDGRGDLIVAGLTATEPLASRVQLSSPVARDVAEVVVTGSTGDPIGRLEDLAGRELWLRADRASSLQALFGKFEQAGLSPIDLRIADPVLEDEDLLELAAGGLLPAVVTDEPLAALWADVLPELRAWTETPLTTTGDKIWAMRPRSPVLGAAVEAFLDQHRRGTLIGNVLLRRYLRDNRWLRNATDPTKLVRFHRFAPIFRAAGERYDIDWLLLTAQGFQESGLDPTVRSSAGAVGIMQLLPSTARDASIKVADLESPELNIHAGARYLRHLVDTYFDESGMSEPIRITFALAAYNAGPSRIRSMRRLARERGLDPDRWFGHVEKVVADHIGRETVQYVAKIFKTRLGYRQLLAVEQARQSAASGAAPSAS